MKWQAHRLDDLGHVSRGRSRHRPRDAAHLYGGPYPFIQTGDVKRAGLYITTHSQTYSAAGLEQSKLWPAGTLCITIAANIADTGILAFDACFPDSVIGFQADDQKADARFLKYLFDATVQQRAKQFSQGATQDNLSQEKLLSIELMTPDVDVQRRVADVLASYDDLIDNNRRRIKLLEDSVRLLFDEWFVNVSESGWPTSTLQQLCVDQGGIQTGPFGSQLHQADYSEEGVPVVMPKDLATMKVDTQTIARIPEHLADELGRHRMQRDDIVFGRRGEIGRRAYIGQRQVGYFCGTGCLRLRPDPARVHPRFLFEVLRTPTVAGDIANRAKGSTMANLSAGALQGVTVPVPPRELQDRFATFAEDVGEQIDTLDEQSRKLRTARDLLLPRLMSGELTV